MPIPEEHRRRRGREVRSTACHAEEHEKRPRRKAAAQDQPAAQKAKASPHQFSLRAIEMRAPEEFPRTAPSYIISAEAAGWMKLPPVVARVLK